MTAHPNLRIVPPIDYDTRPNLYDSLRPSTFERVGEALNSPYLLAFYLGFYVGCIATVVLAFVWSVS